MMSRISSCNATILKKNLTRFWPIMALCAFVGFLLLPMSLSEMDNASVVWQLEDTVSIILPILIFAYAPLCAACVFGYLHNPRSSNMLHAFPVTRNSLFVSNFLSGLLLFLLPWTAVCLVTLLMFTAAGIHLSLLFSIFAVGVLTYLFFFAMSVFCMLLCGKTIFGILVYLFLNYGLAVMEMMIFTIVEPFLFGIDVSGEFLSEYLPILYMVTNPIWGYYGKTGPLWHCNWLFLAILSAFALVLIGLAWLLYRKRHMEQTGNPIAYPRLQGIVHVAVSFFAALALGLFITSTLFYDWEDSALGGWLTVSLLIGGFIGYFGVEMLLRKTPKVFQKKTFLGYGIFAVALTLMMFCVRFDWLNIVGYVPESECVTVEYSFYDAGFASASVTVADPASIEAVRDLHQAIIENRDAVEQAANSYVENWYTIALTYQTDSDSSVTREYRITGATEVRELYEAFEAFLKDQRTTTAYVQALELCDDCSISVLPTDGATYHTLNRTHLEAIREAMLQDVQEGTLDLLTLRCLPDYFYVHDWEESEESLNAHSIFLQTQSGFLMETIQRMGAYELAHCMHPLFIPETATHTYALLSELIQSR